MNDFKLVMISNSSIRQNTDSSTLYQIFHQNTKQSQNYLMENMYKSRQLLNSQSFRHATYNPGKHYPLSTKVQLCSPALNDELSNLLFYRRSQIAKHLHYSLSKTEISNLFWAGYGLNYKKTRTAPSGGALYPCELYGVVINSDEIPKGLYHYSVEDNSLEMMSQDKKVFEYTNYLMGLKNFKYPAMILFITAIFDRNSFKYDDRAYRYTLLEAGGIAQNISLMATKYKLVACQLGGTDDFACENLLQIDGIKESIINALIVEKEGKWFSNREDD